MRKSNFTFLLGISLVLSANILFAAPDPKDDLYLEDNGSSTNPTTDGANLSMPILWPVILP
jgi:hypothetical protein